MTPRTPRRGVALFWALVVLAVLTAAAATATLQFGLARRQQDTRADRAQALWLARSGIELAAAKLLADPAGYAGETVTLVPAGEVRVTVRADGDVYRVESKARFPAGGRLPAVQKAARSFKRAGDRLETVGGRP